MSAKLSVLLATSDDSFTERILEILTKKIYSVMVVNSCKEALENLMDCDFDAVIFDPELKDLDGSDAIELIKKLRPQLPLIVLSDDTSFETGVKIAQAGVYFRLVKPFDEDVTTELMESLEGRKGSHNHSS